MLPTQKITYNLHNKWNKSSINYSQQQKSHYSKSIKLTKMYKNLDVLVTWLASVYYLTLSKEINISQLVSVSFNSFCCLVLSSHKTHITQQQHTTTEQWRATPEPSQNWTRRAHMPASLKPNLIISWIWKEKIEEMKGEPEQCDNNLFGIQLESCKKQQEARARNLSTTKLTLLWHVHFCPSYQSNPTNFNSMRTETETKRNRIIYP